MPKSFETPPAEKNNLPIKKIIRNAVAGAGALIASAAATGAEALAGEKYIPLDTHRGKIEGEYPGGIENLIKNGHTITEKNLKRVMPEEHKPKKPGHAKPKSVEEELTHHHSSTTDHEAETMIPRDQLGPNSDFFKNKK